MTSAIKTWLSCAPRTVARSDTYSEHGTLFQRSDSRKTTLHAGATLLYVSYVLKDKTSIRKRDMARLFKAISQHPAMVTGEGRFFTLFMDAYRGALIGKVGADGCYGIATLGCEQTRKLGAEGAGELRSRLKIAILTLCTARLQMPLSNLTLAQKNSGKVWQPSITPNASTLLA